SVENRRHIHSSKGVTAEFIGTEQSYSMINGKSSVKKILKYRVVTSKDGALETPPIQMSVNGQDKLIDPIAFSVSKEKYAPQISEDDIESPFDDLIPPWMKGKKKTAYTEPSEDDLVVMFETTRDKVYLGETVVGYYNLYYKNVKKPLMERMEAQSPSFPYFGFEYLSEAGVSVTDSRGVYRGKEYFLAPYQRDIFALTPLRNGKFRLGETNFTVEGSPASYFSARSVPAIPKTVTVMSLPSPSPSDFTGEVGEYTASVSLGAQEFHLGESVPILLKIKGKGSGTLIRNPLEKFCTERKCEGNLVFSGDMKKKQFAEQGKGVYGFNSDMEFRYSFLPERTGEYHLGEAKIGFFNPYAEKYEAAVIEMPKFTVQEKRIMEKGPVSSERSNIFLYLFYILSLSSIAFLGYRFRDIILNSFNEFRNTAVFPGIPDDIHSFDILAGSKKEVLLKNFLCTKGYSPANAEEIVHFRKKNQNLSFAELYKSLDRHGRKRLLELVRSKES
ncbi:MAG TPA: BatD family protein, partial [Leptospiraceae bacterium]|nr:BatD family protein [Leptospiraceae bacterium]